MAKRIEKYEGEYLAKPEMDRFLRPLLGIKELSEWGTSRGQNAAANGASQVMAPIAP